MVSDQGLTRQHARDLTAWKDSNPATSYSQVFSNRNYDK